MNETILLLLTSVLLSSTIWSIKDVHAAANTHTALDPSPLSENPSYYDSFPLTSNNNKNETCPIGYYTISSSTSNPNSYLQVYFNPKSKENFTMVSSLMECAELCNVKANCLSVTYGPAKDGMMACYLNSRSDPNGPWIRDFHYCIKTPICPEGYFHGEEEEEEDDDDVRISSWNSYSSSSSNGTTTTSTIVDTLEECGNLCNNTTECYSFEYNNFNSSSASGSHQNCVLFDFINSSTRRFAITSSKDDDSPNTTFCKKKVCPANYEVILPPPPQIDPSSSSPTTRDNDDPLARIVDNSNNGDKQKKQFLSFNNTSSVKECDEFCILEGCTTFEYSPVNLNCDLNPNTTTATTWDVNNEFRCRQTCPVGYDIYYEGGSKVDSSSSISSTATVVKHYSTVDSLQECAGYCTERLECTYFEYSMFENVCKLLNDRNHYETITAWPHTQYRPSPFLKSNNNKRLQSSSGESRSSSNMVGSRYCKKHPTYNIDDDVSFLRALYIIPMITGPISFFSSLYIIYCTIRLGRTHVSKPKSQFLLGLSAYDVCSSFAFSFSTNPAPAYHAELRWMPTYGTTETCEAQGFLVHLGLVGAPMYSAFLCWYYVVSLNHSDRVLAEKRVVPIAHAFVAVFTISTAIVILVNDLFNFDGILGCYINEGKGMLCDEWAYDGGSGCYYDFSNKEWLCDILHFRDEWNIFHNEDCQRGDSDKYNVFLLAFSMVPVCTCFGLVLLAMIILYCRIRRNEINMSRWRTYEGASSTTNRVSRRAIYTALLYSAAFILVYLIAGLNSLGIAQREKWKRFLRILATVFTPLQGFFNLLIFTSPDWLPYVEKLNICRRISAFTNLSCPSTCNLRILSLFGKRTQQDATDDLDPSIDATKFEGGIDLEGPSRPESPSTVNFADAGATIEIIPPRSPTTTVDDEDDNNATQKKGMKSSTEFPPRKEYPPISSSTISSHRRQSSGLQSLQLLPKGTHEKKKKNQHRDVGAVAGGTGAGEETTTDHMSDGTRTERQHDEESKEDEVGRGDDDSSVVNKASRSNTGP